MPPITFPGSSVSNINSSIQRNHNMEKYITQGTTLKALKLEWTLVEDMYIEQWIFAKSTLPNLNANASDSNGKVLISEYYII